MKQVIIMDLPEAMAAAAEVEAGVTDSEGFDPPAMSWFHRSCGIVEISSDAAIVDKGLAVQAADPDQSITTMEEER